jgi:hypothetical protein
LGKLQFGHGRLIHSACTGHVAIRDNENANTSPQMPLASEIAIVCGLNSVRERSLSWIGTQLAQDELIRRLYGMLLICRGRKVHVVNYCQKIGSEVKLLKI